MKPDSNSSTLRRSPQTHRPIELQRAQTIALDNFRVNRLHVIEENMFAYGELGPLSGKTDTEHPQVHHALFQAQVFVLKDRAFHNLSLSERRITRNIHKNLKLLCGEQARLKAEARPLTRTASITIEPNGFGFSRKPVTPAVEVAAAFPPSEAPPKAA